MASTTAPTTAEGTPVSSSKTHQNNVSFSADSKSLILTASEENQHTVALSFDAPYDSDKALVALRDSSPFREWVLNFSKANDSKLESLAIQHVDLATDGSLKTALIEPMLKGAVERQGPVLVTCQRQSVGVLVVLRATFSHSTNQPASRADRGGSKVAFNRDFVLFSRTSRSAVGQANSLEIMKGYFNEQGEFICSASQELEAMTDTKIHQKDLVLLSRDGPVAVAPELLVERDDLYLYRQNITDAQFDVVPKAYDRAPATLRSKSQSFEQLRLTVLNEAWKITFDSRSLAALFLFHEFRYHGLMPKYRPPVGTHSPEKKKPSFSDVKSLRPDSVGVNLKLVVVEPPADVPGRECKLVVGDCTGIINARVEGDYSALCRGLEKGAKVLIRNCHIDVIQNFMCLAVDKWGKIEILSDPDATLLSNKVELANDRSAVEYELVPAENATPANNERHQPPRTTGRGRGRGRGRRPSAM